MRDFFATCPKGLEYLLVDELKALAASDVHEALSGVWPCRGRLEAGYRACLWSRLASRILMPISEFAVENGDQLYEGAKTIDWTEHFPADATFAIDAVGSTTGITHSQYAAFRVKDAIVDQLRDKNGERPNVDTQTPDLRINLALRKGNAIVSIDLSGAPLHQRGYRKGTGLAPLKENLACAMLLRAGWPAIYVSGGGIVDPLCGSGTLLIEAAMMAADVAPGLRRERFGFAGWKGYDAALWKMLHDDAQTRASSGLQQLQSVFFGFDQDPSVLNEAKRNAQEAELSGFIQFGRQSLDHLHRPHELETPGLVISNPPYGERLNADENIIALYRLLGEKFKAEFPGWHASVITSEVALGRAIGLHADKKYRLYNGALECTLFNFDLTPRAETREIKPLSTGGQMVANPYRQKFSSFAQARATRRHRMLARL